MDKSCGDTPLLATEDGELFADNDGKAASAAAVRRYLEKAFGDRLDEVCAVMAAAATAIPLDEMNRVGFRIYEGFRPEVPVGAEGWGSKGELVVERIQAAADGVVGRASDCRSEGL